MSAHAGWPPIVTLLFCTLCALILSAALASPGSAGAETLPSTLETGRSIYNFRCYFCHGYSGNARTLAATFLEPPPRDFTTLDPNAVGREAMIETLRRGRPGTAMMSFAATLNEAEISAVVDFVRNEFMTNARVNTRYHIPANGWPEHERYRSAYPFALGEISLDRPPEELSREERIGRRLFLASCVTCHDHGKGSANDLIWEREAISYPRFGFGPGDILKPPDAYSGASPFARHDVPPVLENLDDVQREGEALFQGNCSFCHAADGTGKNWIGRFMQPHPRDLTSEAQMAGMTRERLRHVIREGLPGTSMPAWAAVLKDSEIKAIVEYIHVAFHPLEPSSSRSAEAAPSPEFGRDPDR